jgi:transposase
MQFQELTDMQWDLVKPSLPSPALTGRPRADDRMTINGILYVLMSGCRWMDICHPDMVLIRQSLRAS